MTQSSASSKPRLGATKAQLRIASFRWHLLLAWVGALALLCYVISAATHPLLAWTGPQSAAFRPPTAVMQAEQLAQVRKIIEQHNIRQAVMLKLIPSEDGVVLQLSEDENRARRYFNLTSHAELLDYDSKHAQWLARYYALAGDNSVPIKSVEFQTEFDDAYPWVNRLLPVYKVTFDNDEQLNAFVYTEINALASISNTYKTQLQSIFRALHTWSWLNGLENLRIILISCLMLSIFAITMTGASMILLIKRRKTMTRKASLHRWIATIVWLPLLAFSISGFWHLLHYGFSDVHRGLELGAQFSLADLHSAPATELQQLPTQPLNQISVVQHSQQLFYRLSLAKQAKSAANANSGEHAQHTASKQTREARFKGQATEQGGLYFSVESGQQASLSDKEVAIEIAIKQLSLAKESVTNAQLITRFGPHYDFRNKRLPVWQVDFDSPLGDKAFIDPATGMLVDRLVDLDRYEGYSFSFLHKWSFLTPFTGRMWRDVVVVVMLGLVLILTILGISMRLTKKRRA